MNDLKLLKQYIKINKVDYYVNCYFCDYVKDSIVYYEIIKDDKTIGLIFKAIDLKLVLDEEVIYDK